MTTFQALRGNKNTYSPDTLSFHHLPSPGLALHLALTASFVPGFLRFAFARGRGAARYFCRAVLVDLLAPLVLLGVLVADVPRFGFTAATFGYLAAWRVAFPWLAYRTLLADTRHWRELGFVGTLRGPGALARRKAGRAALPELDADAADMLEPLMDREGDGEGGRSADRQLTDFAFLRIDAFLAKGSFGRVYAGIYKGKVSGRAQRGDRSS